MFTSLHACAYYMPSANYLLRVITMVECLGIAIKIILKVLNNILNRKNNVIFH